MAGVVSLLNQSQRKVQIIQNGNTVITVDASINETHSRASPPTKFEIENGQNITDHQILEPFSLKLQGIISDTPLNSLGALINSGVTTGVSFAAGPIGVIAGGAGVALFNALAKSKSPSVAAYGQLLALQSAKQPFDVLTTLQLYKNMWISNLSVPRDAGTGRSLVFDLDLVQLLLVTPQSINIVKFAAPDLSAAQANKGKKETSEAVKFFRQGVGDANSLASKGLPG